MKWICLIEHSKITKLKSNWVINQEICLYWLLWSKNNKPTIYKSSIMSKGLLILFLTIIIVGLIHYISIKLLKISEVKKYKYRRLFWYFYSIIFMLSGGINLIEKAEFYWSFFLEFLVGLIIFILNFLEKIEPKKA